MAFVLLAAFIVIGLLFALTSGSDVTSNEVKIPEVINLILAPPALKHYLVAS